MRGNFLAIVAFPLLAVATIGMSSAVEPTWQRPKTTRRYVQGPLAERVLAYWREGKVTVGEVQHFHDWKKTVYNVAGATPLAHGVWLLHGEKDEPFGFEDAEMRTEADATPIHGQSWRSGDLEVDLEACTPFGRTPSANLRLRVANRGIRPLTHRFALLLRSGEERQLVFSAPDLYAVYAPRLQQWLDLPSTWRASGEGVWSDGDRFVTAAPADALTWDGELGAIRFTATLEPETVRTFDFVIGEGAVERPDYAARRDRTRADWQRELARVSDRTDLIRRMTVQMLQCFSRAKGRDYMLPRQGCLQRWVWPGDQKQVSAALGLLGYNEYVEGALAFYFGEYQMPSGEIGPFGNGWANDTASVLEIFSRYCLDTGHAACWRTYRDRAVQAFGWIRAKRRESIGRAGCVEGLFPPMKATDAGEVFQAWGYTDLANLLAEECLATAAERFGDAKASDFRAEANAYRTVIGDILERWRQTSAGKDTFHIPLDPKGTLEPELRRNNYFYSHPGRFVDQGFLSDDEILRLRNWLLKEGYANERGFYQRNPTPVCWDTGEPVPLEIAANVWYTTASELQWFRAWKRMGRDDLARQTLEAMLMYSVTEEGYVGERYNSVSPWYFPWSPNASGAGRIVQMLLTK